MARLNVDDSLFTDPRFLEFSVGIKNEEKAIGWWVKVARLAQSYWKYDKKLIPKAVYRYHKFPKQMESYGLTEEREEGYYLHGSESSFEWIFQKVENGRKGGKTKKTLTGKANEVSTSLSTAEDKLKPPTPTPTLTHIASVQPVDCNDSSLWNTPAPKKSSRRGTSKVDTTDFKIHDMILQVFLEKPIDQLPSIKTLRQKITDWVSETDYTTQHLLQMVVNYTEFFKSGKAGNYSKASFTNFLSKGDHCKWLDEFNPDKLKSVEERDEEQKIKELDQAKQLSNEFDEYMEEK